MRKETPIYECHGRSGSLWEYPAPKTGRVGHYGIQTNLANVPLVPGVRYRFTVEVVGANPAVKPTPFDYHRNWARPKDVAAAKAYLKSKKQQRAMPRAKEHMLKVLAQYKEDMAAYRAGLKFWKWAQQFEHSQPGPEV